VIFSRKPVAFARRSKRLSAFINAAVRVRLGPDRAALDRAYQTASREAWRRELADDWLTTETQQWPG